MKKLEAYCNVQDGKFNIVHRDKFVKALSELAPGRYALTISRKYNKRSNQQNAVIWGYVYPMVLQGLRDSGFENMDINKVHELLKFKFLKYEIVSTDGEILESVRSTASLTTVEMMQYLSDIQKFAAEYLSINIPDPGQEIEIKFEN